MFIRTLERGECQEHGKRCWTAALMECDECQREYVVHQTYQRAKQSYCSKACAKVGNAKAIADAVEGRKRFKRIKYGTPIYSK